MALRMERRRQLPAHRQLTQINNFSRISLLFQGSGISETLCRFASQTINLFAFCWKFSISIIMRFSPYLILMHSTFIPLHYNIIVYDCVIDYDTKGQDKTVFKLFRQQHIVTYFFHNDLKCFKHEICRLHVLLWL